MVECWYRMAAAALDCPPRRNGPRPVSRCSNHEPLLFHEAPGQRPAFTTEQICPPKLHQRIKTRSLHANSGDNFVGDRVSTAVNQERRAVSRLAVVVAVALGLAACGNSRVQMGQAVVPNVYGAVTAGPTCPVERLGQLCPPKPVQGIVEAHDRLGRPVASSTISPTGGYVLTIPTTGSYDLSVITGSAFPHCPARHVTAPKEGRVRVDIACDTGIR